MEETQATVQQASIVSDFGAWLETLPVHFQIVALIVTTVVAIIIAKVIIAVIAGFIRNLAKKSENFTPLMGGFAIKIVQVIVWVITFMIVLGFWGVNLAPVIAGVGVSGVILGLALQETIASVFAGFMIAVTKPFAIGDFVEIGSVSGTIISMDTIAVGLNTPDNRKVVMANKLVWGAVITNYSANETRRVDMVFNLSYDADLKKAQKVLTDLMLSYPEVLKDPAPVVAAGEFGDASFQIYARPYCKSSDFWTVKFKFQQDAPNALKAAGISMPHRQLDVHVSQN
ncbi:MAG: mechanosensitive ion channel family protein [Spirochaetales bacterium]|nr:mechanosensitive ion channel family protein [Spirochaetales bacterium]